jgi:hypothetical protein
VEAVSDWLTDVRGAGGIGELELLKELQVLDSGANS